MCIDYISFTFGMAMVLCMQNQRKSLLTQLVYSLFHIVTIYKPTERYNIKIGCRTTASVILHLNCLK